MGCFNDPAWKVCGWVMGWGGWLTPTTYIQLAGAGSIIIKSNKLSIEICYVTLAATRATFGIIIMLDLGKPNSYAQLS